MATNHVKSAVAAMCSLVLVASACSSSSNDAEPADGATVSNQVTAAPQAGSCGVGDSESCLLPWPNDRLTKPDGDTVTGKRIDLPEDDMPSNTEGTPIGVDEWARNDGFSPAAMPMVVINDLDPVASELPPVTDIGASLDPDSPLMLVDLTTGERVPAWTELDSQDYGAQTPPLIVVPATALLEGHSHLVVLRDLVDMSGNAIESPDEFLDQFNDPDAHATALNDGLSTVGLTPENVVIAWQFTVSSGESITGRLRHMWGKTSEEVGDGAPEFTVNSAEQSGAMTVIEGSFETPNYLTGDGSPGSVMNNGDNADGLPELNGTMETEFTCSLPTAANASSSAPVVLYGHGLLGSRSEALNLGAVAASAGIAFCAIDWIGMSANDVPTVVETLGDLTGFRAVPDRLQQGHLAWLLLGRLVASDEGFASAVEFQDDSGNAAIDQSKISFLGASQGGILGGVPSALTSDWTQVVLAVPGMAYNTLLPRSIDFDEFSPVLNEAYPDPLDRALGRELLEMLWDRGENAGWAQHLTADTYDGAEEKNVLILEAFGDHQVANVATQKLARTLGVARIAPSLREGRSTDKEPFFGIPPIESLPTTGSAMLTWDFGTPAPPISNTPPCEGDDPHGDLGEEAAALALVISFTSPEGIITDVCAGQPCVTETSG